MNGANSATESYLKFDLRPLAGLAVSQATLRMWVVSGSGGEQSIRDLSNNSWTERTLTYGNRPAKGAIFTTFSAGTASGVWKEVDVSYAAWARAGSFMSLVVDTASPGGYRFNSEEASNKRVELLVSWGGPTPAPTPVMPAGGLPNTGGPYGVSSGLWLLLTGAVVLVVAVSGVLAIGVPRLALARRAPASGGAWSGQDRSGDRRGRSDQAGTGAGRGWMLVVGAAAAIMALIAFILASAERDR